MVACGLRLHVLSKLRPREQASLEIPRKSEAKIIHNELRMDVEDHISVVLVYTIQRDTSV